MRVGQKEPTILSFHRLYLFECDVAWIFFGGFRPSRIILVNWYFCVDYSTYFVALVLYQGLECVLLIVFW